MSIVAASATLAPPSSTRLCRHLADYHPTLWNDYFLQYASESLEVDEEVGTQVETVKEVIRNMLVSAMENPLTEVELVDSIQRLGLSYHFEREIDELLQQIHNTYVQNDEIVTHTEDLHSLALLFKLLRQEGYPISADMFNKFKDEQGNFSEKIGSDVEGMLSLYEAAHLSVHGEDILDEALAFTLNRLRSITTVESNPFLAAKLQHSLKQCPYRGLPRLEARRYISIYHLNPSCHQVLLKLAKLDFNMLQKLHQKEFGNICKWWNKLDVQRNHSYARNRIVELSFWILTVYFEPQYSKARSIMTKAIALLSIIDDTFDAYGTIDELELLNEAIQRWDIRCLDDLPDYIKLCYKELLNVFQEIDEDMRKEGRSYSVHHSKQEFKKTVEAYMTEARWLIKKHIPTAEEYINVSTVSTCYPALSTISFIGMGDIASEDVFKWAQSHPKVIKASALICRLMDDIVSSEFEKKREHIASLIECYMKDYGVSKQEAIGELEKKIRNAWKDINEECLRPDISQVMMPKPIVMRVLNMTRFINVMYKDADNFTHSGGLMKDSIQLVILDPVPI